MSKKESIERRILKRVIRCYQRGTGWCRGSFAKDKHERTVLSTSPDAVAYCIAGAIGAAGAKHPLDLITITLREFCYKKYGIHSIASVNDTILETKKDVIGFLKEALKTVP